MKNFFKKLSFVLAIAMVLTSLTPATASAASKNFVTLKGNSTKAVTSVYAWIGGVTRNLDYNINGKTSGVKGTWKSSNEEFVKVNPSTGVITPVANGSAYVTFTTADGKTTVKTVVKARTRAAALHIYDKAEYAAGNKVQLENKEGVTPSAIELKVGETKDLRITMPLSKKQQDAGAKIASYYTYAEVGDNAVVEAAKDAEGNERAYTLTAKAVGETTVTIVANQSTLANVRANKYYKEATINVKVNEAEPDVAVKQTGAMKINMTGKDLTNVTADYVLKRGTVTVELDKVAFATTGDAVSVDLTTKNRLVTGEYTLKFKENEALPFSVQASRMDHFDIPSDTLPLNADYNLANGAVVSYHAYNQFGEDITKTVSTVNANSSFGTAQPNAGKGTITVLFGASKPMLNSTGTIVLVDTSTGINYTKTLTLGMQAKADTIEVLGIYNSSTSEPMTIVEGSRNTNAVLLVKVFDQYGGELNNLDCTNDVSFSFSAGQTEIKLPDGTSTSSNFETTVDVEGINYVAIPLSAANAKSGTAQLFFVSKTTGKNVQYTITVGANATVKTFEAYPIQDVYEGKEAEFGYSAMTEDGAAVTSYDILSSAKYGIEVSKIQVDAGTAGNFRWVKQSDGSAKLFFEANPLGLTDSQPSKQVSAAFITPGYTSTVITFSIQQAPKPVDIKRVKPDVIRASVSGGSIKFGLGDFIFEDQYGNDMDGLIVGTYFANNPSITVKALDNSISGNAIPSGSVTGAAISGGSIIITMAAVSVSEGSKISNISFSMMNGGQTMGKGCATTVGVAALSALSKYEIKTNDTVYAPATPASGKSLDFPADKYDWKQKFEVFAYLGDRKAAIPTDCYDVLSYNVAGEGVSSGAVMVEVTKSAVSATMSAVSGGSAKWNTSVATDTKRDVTITLGITGTAITVSKTVSASRLAPVATTVNAQWGVTGVTVNGDNVEIYAEDNVGKGANATVDLSKFLIFKDQYGKDASKLSSITVVISNVQSASATPVSITGNGTAKPTFNGTLASNDSYTATVSCGTKTVTVNVLVK